MPVPFIQVDPHPTFAGDLEWALSGAVARFPGAVRDAAAKCEPHLAARAVLDLARSLSRFYHDAPVLRAEPGVREARLQLAAVTALTLRQGLWALGIDAPPMRAD